MLKYRLLKEINKDGITIEEPIFETKDKGEFLNYLKNKNININKKDLTEIEKQLREFIEEKQNIVERETPDLPFESKLEFIYSPTISRKVVNTEKAPDEYMIVEIEYIPLDFLKKEIEKIFDKEVNIDLENKIYFRQQRVSHSKHTRILLTQYSPQIKKTTTKASIQFDEEKYKKLKSIEEIFNQLIK